jgi:hypothetical protein
MPLDDCEGKVRPGANALQPVDDGAAREIDDILLHRPDLGALVDQTVDFG